eukprot:6541843-Prymnesium_polylepis.1
MLTSVVRLSPPSTSERAMPPRQATRRPLRRSRCSSAPRVPRVLPLVSSRAADRVYARLSSERLTVLRATRTLGSAPLPRFGVSEAHTEEDRSTLASIARYDAAHNTGDNSLVVNNIGELRQALQHATGSMLALRLPGNATFELGGEPLKVSAGMNVTLDQVQAAHRIELAEVLYRCSTNVKVVADPMSKGPQCLAFYLVFVSLSWVRSHNLRI